MLRVGVRELRNDVAAVVRRAGAGERVIVTVDGKPVAQLGPLEPATLTLDDLVATGLVRAPSRPRPDAPEPEDTPVDARTASAIEELRG